MKRCRTIEVIKQRLLDAGVNLTAQRIAICRFVLCDANHPTADDVKLWADENFPLLSRATIYNTLHILVAANMLKEVRHTHSNKVIYDANTSAHHHFLDIQTGRLVDVDPKYVEVKTQLPPGMQIDDVEILLKGHVQS